VIVRSRLRVRVLAAVSISSIFAMALTSVPASATSTLDVSSLDSTTKPFVGVYVPHVTTDLASFAKLTGVKPNLVMFFKNWNEHKVFDAAEYNKVHELGATPIIAWEPWNPNRNPIKQADYRLSRIIAGKFDPMIHDWARGLKSLNYPVMLRFAHEMNGHWYPWAVRSNGNKPYQFVKAWKHVHDIFVAEGAQNVAWVWSPNVNRSLKGIALKGIYPGDSYVDIVGLVGFGTQKGDTFNKVFATTISEIRKFTTRKMLITETAAQELNVNKPAWIKDFFRQLSKRSYILGYVWFNQTKRAHWRVDTSKASLSAYRAGVKYYATHWKPGRLAKSSN
jgi:mannan endo-1,4-beta-mannosidase